MTTTKLTRAMSIEECKKLWADVEASGLSKQDFLKSKAGRKWREKAYLGNCPLCQYDHERKGDCLLCPLEQQYAKGCFDLGFLEKAIPIPEWLNAIKGLKVRNSGNKVRGKVLYTHRK